MIRIMGEDGKVDLKWINKPTGEQEPIRKRGQPTRGKIENDVTVGAYDVVLETGPSYTTKREEAKDSMKEFIQSSPEPRRSSWTCTPRRRTGRWGRDRQAV
jgi:hypothetical protein